MMIAVFTPMTSPVRRRGGPARDARIERRVGLHHVVQEPAGPSAQRAAERADDAGRDRVLETKRAAEGDGDLPHAYARRIAEPDHGKSPASDPQHRQIRSGSSPMIGASATRPSGGVTSMRGRAIRDVAVGDEQAIGREEKSRTGAVAQGFADAARRRGPLRGRRARPPMPPPPNRRRAGRDRALDRGVVGGEVRGACFVGRASARAAHAMSG